MSGFITLTSLTSGTKLRINTAHMVSYFRSAASGSDLVFMGDHEFTVTETPEQIDAMLGVTADPVRDAAHELLAALIGCVGRIESLTPEGAAAYQAARDAIARATGQTAGQ